MTLKAGKANPKTEALLTCFTCSGVSLNLSGVLISLRLGVDSLSISPICSGISAGLSVSVVTSEADESKPNALAVLGPTIPSSFNPDFL